MKRLIKNLIQKLPTSLKYGLYRSQIKVTNTEANQVIFKLAETREELEGAFKLLHDSYVHVGLMKPSPSGLRVTPYHALPSSVTLIGKMGDEVIATLTIIADSKLGLPSDNFIDLSKLRQGGNRIAEISALAIKKEYRGKMLLHLLKYMYEWCINYISIDHLIATLTTDTKAYELYEAVLFFKKIENKIEANYEFSNFRPVIAEHLNLHEAHDLFKQHYNNKKGGKNLFNFFVNQKMSNFIFPNRPYHTISYPVMNPSNFSYFFSEKTTALVSMPTNSLLELRNIFLGYPQVQLIDQVLKERNVYSINRFAPKDRFNVSFETKARSNESLVNLRVLDISSAGLKIVSQEPLDNCLEIMISADNGTTYKIKAQKMWQDEFGVAGLKILSVDNNWSRMIQDFSKILKAGHLATASRSNIKRSA